MNIRFSDVLSCSVLYHAYILGYPNTASTAMRRWDHAPFISMQLPNYAVKFSIRNDKSEYANKTTAVEFFLLFIFIFIILLLYLLKD